MEDMVEVDVAVQKGERWGTVVTPDWISTKKKW